MLGVGGIIVYSEMCGRVAAVSGRPVFDLVRERLGFAAGLGTLAAATLVTLMTCTAEVGGLAIVLQLLSGWEYRLLILLGVAALVLAAWFLRFEWIERLFGYVGPVPAGLRRRGRRPRRRLGRGGERPRAERRLRATTSSTRTSPSACSAPR